jgi:multidrug efflux pump subunit AcrB
MNISSWSIRNPVPAIALFVLLTIIGIRSFVALSIQDMPDMELPTITVSASLEGAAPSQLETEVARPIEDAVASLGGIKHVRTTLTDGMASIRVEFNIDKNAEVALNEVRNAVDGVRADLPGSMSSPTVSKATTTGSPILTFATHSETLAEEPLSWFVDNDVAKALLAVPGVGKVERVGGVTREVHVDLDPARLAALGVTASDVSTRLKAVQQDASGGRGDVGGAVQSVRTLAAVGSVEQIAALRIPTSNGRNIRIDQVATVRDTFAQRSGYALLEDRPVVGFQVTRSKGASEITVAKAVRAAIGKLQQAHPQVTITEAYDTVAPVQDNYTGSMELLLEGAILAVIVVWLFLRDWRATLVAAAALPLSILPTFAAINYLGFTLSSPTLLSLALVVGVLVDDAIVEIENIMRHLRMGRTPYEAAMEAADEIGLAVVATTLTLVAVFLPTAFMGGIPGKIFSPFGWTAAMAVLASLLVARLLTPMMAAYLLKPLVKVGEEVRDSWLMARYLLVARWCLNHRKTTVSAAALFFVGSLALIMLLPAGFLPVADDAQTSVTLELAPGSTLDETRAIAAQARQRIRQVPEVVHTFTNVGSVSEGGVGPGADSSSSDVRKATITVKLTDRSDRSRKQSAVEAELRQQLGDLPATHVSVGAGGSGEMLQVVLASDNPQALDEASRAVGRDLRTLKGVGNQTSSASLQRPEVHIDPDTSRAADLGVTTQALSDAVRVATSGDYESSLPKLNLPERQLPIRVRLDRDFREDLDRIAQLRVPGRAGDVTLGSVATVSLGSGPAQIDRLDRQRNVRIDVELNGRVIGDVLKEVEQLPAISKLPAGVSRPAAGDQELMADLFTSFAGAMVIGVVCVYFVLVLLFHDFLQPVTILTALPLSVGGALLALLVTGKSFSMPSAIGILMLMGIVTKNSILLVDYAIMARDEHGLNRFDALIDACHKRAQPILMTTIAMGLGMLPIALGLGAEPSFRSPMATVVIGGLLTSTLLSLLVIPVVFSYVDDLMQAGRHLIAPRPAVAASARLS